MHPRRKTLLVVDDDRILCETLRDSLESEDLSVLIAHTAGECLAECAGKKTDVVLLDQKLPDREGPFALKFSPIMTGPFFALPTPVSIMRLLRSGRVPTTISPNPSRLKNSVWL